MLFSYHLLYFCTALSLIIMLSSHYHHHKSKTFSQLTQCPFTGTLLLLTFHCRFDPERFSDKNRKSIPSCGFEPFGFAGKRKCPGYQLTYLEASVIISDLVRRFKVNMVDGQVVETYYGLVTRPKEEVWITVTKRK